MLIFYNQNVKRNEMKEKRSDSEREKKSVKENGNYRKKNGRDKKRQQKLQKVSQSQVFKLVIKLLKTKLLKRKPQMIIRTKRA